MTHHGTHHGDGERKPKKPVPKPTDDLDAPFGFLEDGTPWAPWGVRKDGRPRRGPGGCPAGFKRPSKDERVVRAVALGFLEDMASMTTEERRELKRREAGTYWSTAREVLRVAKNMGILDRLSDELREPPTIRIIREEKVGGLTAQRLAEILADDPAGDTPDGERLRRVIEARALEVADERAEALHASLVARVAELEGDVERLEGEVARAEAEKNEALRGAFVSGKRKSASGSNGSRPGGAA